MVTTAAAQTDFLDAISSVVQLDFDAIEAYDAAIERVESDPVRAKLSEFRDDHKRHTEELGAIVERLGGDRPRGPGSKAMLTEGKVRLAGLADDRAILMAMKTNEDDTNTAYERLDGHDDKPAEAAEAVRRGREDEARHRAWIEQQIDQMG